MTDKDLQEAEARERKEYVEAPAGKRRHMDESRARMRCAYNGEVPAGFWVGPEKDPLSDAERVPPSLDIAALGRRALKTTGMLENEALAIWYEVPEETRHEIRAWGEEKAKQWLRAGGRPPSDPACECLPGRFASLFPVPLLAAALGEMMVRSSFDFWQGYIKELDSEFEMKRLEATIAAPSTETSS